MTTINDLDDFKALEPFFQIIQEGLDGLVDGLRGLRPPVAPGPFE